MFKYVITRILWMIPIMIGVIIVVFTISYISPGDPVLLLIPSDYTQDVYDAKAAQFGLDQPYIVQVGTTVLNIFTKLDLGKSFMTSYPISYELASRIPISLRINLISIVLMIVIGLPLGILSALKRYSLFDLIVTPVSLIFAAIPGFIMAILSALLFGVILKWLPINGLDTWKHWILPVACSSGIGVAVYVRMSRTTMLEIIRQDYVRTARAKGLAERTVVIKHALPNCLVILITTLGAQLASIFGGSIIVETIFGIPGVGTFMQRGISSRDYPVITGSVFVMALLVCSVNICVDIAYAFVDPRIKARFTSPKQKIKRIEAKKEGSV